MKNHKGMIRGFHWSNRAWYSNIVDEKEVNFGMYSPTDGGTSGEMSMKWIWLNGQSTPKLECFDDGWSALGLFTDLLQKMGEHDSEDITDNKFVEILLECGFKDLTAYKDPTFYEDKTMITWKDIFDGEKFSNHTLGSTDIYMVNEFVSRYTNYAFFSFNGTVFPVRAVEQFDSDYVSYHYSNGVKVSSLR